MPQNALLLWNTMVDAKARNSKVAANNHDDMHSICSGHYKEPKQFMMDAIIFNLWNIMSATYIVQCHDVFILGPVSFDHSFLGEDLSHASWHL